MLGSSVENDLERYGSGSWPNLWFYPRVYLLRKWKTMKTHNQDNQSLWAEI
jgi:hypothetical protein